MTVTPPLDERFPWEEEPPPDESQTSLWEQPPDADAVDDESSPTEPAPAAADAAPGAARDKGVTGAAAEDEDGEDPLEAAGARLAPRDRPIAPKEYYSISEVCDLVGLKPHVLRYWETQFPVLNPSKNRSGNRVYQRKEIRLVLLVKHLLYEEKYTVEGAKQKIEQIRRSGKLRESTTRALDEEAMALLRDELRQLLKILTPSGSG